jgi:hypothetical protein
MSDTFHGNGYTIEFLGIQSRPVPTSDTPPQNPDSINFGPAAQVTIEKSGAVTVLFWPWGWLPVANGGDDGLQDAMYMAKSFADKQIEVAGL